MCSVAKILSILTIFRGFLGLFFSCFREKPLIFESRRILAIGIQDRVVDPVVDHVREVVVVDLQHILQSENVKVVHDQNLDQNLLIADQSRDQGLDRKDI